MSYYEWRSYVPVAERRRKAESDAAQYPDHQPKVDERDGDAEHEHHNGERGEAIVPQGLDPGGQPVASLHAEGGDSHQRQQGGGQQQPQRCDRQCQRRIDAATSGRCEAASAARALSDGIGWHRRKNLHEPAIGAADELGRGTLVQQAQGHA